MQRFQFQPVKQGVLSIRACALAPSFGPRRELDLRHVLSSPNDDPSHERCLIAEERIAAIFDLAYHDDLLVLSALQLPRAHPDLTLSALEILRAHLNFEALKTGRRHVQVDLPFEPKPPWDQCSPRSFLQQLLAGSIPLPTWKRHFLRYATTAPTIVHHKPPSLQVRSRWLPE